MSKDINSYPKMTAEELNITIKQLSKIYDVVRVVDTNIMRIITYDDNGKKQVSDASCHAIWGCDERCKNCVSSIAFQEKSRLSKLDFIDDEVYHVTSQYITVDGNPYLLEIVDKYSNKMLYASFGKEKIVESLKEYSNKIYTDSLTNIANRNYLEEQLMDLEMDAVAMIDIDNFKSFNDIGGHAYGDLVLQKIAKEIQNNIRSDDSLVRYGGDEFLIAFPFMKYSCLKEKLEYIRSEVDKNVLSKYKELPITISIGGAYGRDTTRNLFIKADKALYKSKETKNRVTIYDDSSC